MGFQIGGFEYSMERNPCLQSKWRTLNLVTYRSPNRQIKMTAKYSGYTVH